MKFHDYANRRKPLTTRSNNNVQTQNGLNIVREKIGRKGANDGVKTAEAPKTTPPPNQSQADVERRERLKRYEKVAGGLLPEERIEYVYRRHWIHIFHVGWIWLAFLFVMLIALLISTILNLSIVTLVLFGILLIIGVPVLIYLINDWLNDYLIATNFRVIHIEKTLFIRKEVREVQAKYGPNAKLETNRTPIEFVLNTGTVTIESLGRQAIVFNNVYDPFKVRNQIDSQFKSYFAERNKRRAEIMNDYVDKKTRGETPPLIINDGREVDAIDPATANWWQKTFPAKPFETRDDKGNITTTWHTHPWILVKRLYFPILFALGWLLVSIAPLPFLLSNVSFWAKLPFIVAYLLIFFALPWAVGKRFFGHIAFVLLWAVVFIFGLPNLFGFDNWLVRLVSFLVYIGTWVVLAILLWYEYEDWKNDTYVVAFDEVRDMNQSPFGFSRAQKIIKLNNIQDVEWEKPNIVATFFNYGNVSISAVGSSAKTEFKSLPNPEEVADEITRKVEEWKFRVVDTAQDRLYADFLINNFPKIQNILREREIEQAHKDNANQNRRNQP